MHRRRPQILMYHSVLRAPQDPNRVCTSPERFETHMRYLKRHGLHGVSMRELLHRVAEQGSTEGAVGLTFDDGYEDFLLNALPILEKFRFSATVFVVGGLIGEENTWDSHGGIGPRLKLLGIDGIREISERGMEVGSHSMTHVPLAGLDPESLEEEVAGSRRVLGELLGEPVEGFGYPYGSLDVAAIRAVRRAGYSYACAVSPQTERSVYTFSRIPLWERDTIPRFAAKRAFFWQYHAAKLRVLRGLRLRREDRKKDRTSSV